MGARLVLSYETHSNALRRAPLVHHLTKEKNVMKWTKWVSDDDVCVKREDPMIVSEIINRAIALPEWCKEVMKEAVNIGVGDVVSVKIENASESVFASTANRLRHQISNLDIKEGVKIKVRQRKVDSKIYLVGVEDVEGAKGEIKHG